MLVDHQRRFDPTCGTAQILFERFQGAWDVSQLVTNVTGTTFWRSVIPVPFDEEAREQRIVQHFTIEG